MLPAIMICAAVAVFLAVILIRGALLKPEKTAAAAQPVADFDDPAAIARFQKVLQKKTVWPREGKIEYAEFDGFVPLLKQLYPTVFANTELTMVNTYGLIVKWKGRDPSKAPVILMAHHDVVSAEAADWTYPPFAAEIHDGNIYARGAFDTKCILTAVFEAMQSLMAENYTPARDIYFISSNNEETGGDTSPAQMEWFRRQGVKPWFVLDEGGAMINELPLGIRYEFAMIGVSEKGVVDVKLTAKGAAGHSSTPSGENSTVRLLQALDNIRDHPFKAQISPVLAEMFRKLAAHASFLYRVIFANIGIFSPIVKKIMSAGGETNAMIRTTTALTQLSGSDTINTIPTDAGAGYSVRVAPWDNTADVENRIKELAGAHVEVAVPYKFEPSPYSDFKSEAYQLIANTAKTVYPGADDAPYVMSGGTDSKHFTEICSNVFRFAGFRFTSAERRAMHGVDEHLSADAYLKGVTFYIQLMKSL
ncbi:MAG: M20/M25/M40 family metallo-hydrolase [Clostridia bacterium]|nr:M20/M25/M40 family metallo-hydrolase [Clostridia bacterium]